jgi:peptide-methionine (S)-S-oxide reductase
METKTVVLGGGCFWGMEELFRKQVGVVSTEVGYAGGENADPTYGNHPGHAEVLRITYDSTTTTLRALLDYFFRIHDPTTPNRQGNDVGTSYRSVVFYENEEDRIEMEAVKERVNASGRWKEPVVTAIEPLRNYGRAEEEHQNYLQKHPGGYTCHIERFGSYF